MGKYVCMYMEKGGRERIDVEKKKNNRERRNVCGEEERMKKVE